MTQVQCIILIDIRLIKSPSLVPVMNFYLASYFLLQKFMILDGPGTDTYIIIPIQYAQQPGQESCCRVPCISDNSYKNRLQWTRASTVCEGSVHEPTTPTCQLPSSLLALLCPGC